MAYELNLDPVKLQKVLQQFAETLTDIPKWTGLMSYEGKFICSYGSPDEHPHRLPENELIAKMTHALASQEIKSLNTLNLGNLQYSIHIGGEGTYIIVGMNDAWLLGISYHGVGKGCCCTSLDRL